MTVTQWLDFFRRNGQKKVFSFGDLAHMTGLVPEVLRVELSRLAKRGIVRRLAREWYANPFAPPSAEEAAMVLRSPCYISLEYALFAEGILSQAPFAMTCVTPKASRVFRPRQGPIYEYRRISRGLFWGWREVPQGSGVRYAWPEKALLDLVYVRHFASHELDRTALLSMLDDMYLEELDAARMRDFLERFESPWRKGMVGVFREIGALARVLDAAHCGSHRPRS